MSRAIDARRVWHNMRQRCCNPNLKTWKDYGGRGITVRFASFEEFIAEVGERPPGMTIDRIDNNGHYERGNVRWATRAEQQRNRRNAVFVTIDGVEHRLMDLAKSSGLKRETIVDRAKRGLSFTEVMSPERTWNLTGFALGGRASGAKKQQRTHCIRGHEFTAENVQFSREGWRRCRECHNAKARRLNAAKRDGGIYA